MMTEITKKEIEMEIKGTIDASTNPELPEKPNNGNIWGITETGEVGGVKVLTGDQIAYSSEYGWFVIRAGMAFSVSPGNFYRVSIHDFALIIKYPNPEENPKPLKCIDEYQLDKADQEFYALLDMVERSKRSESIKDLAKRFLQISFAASDVQKRLNIITDSMNGILYQEIAKRLQNE